MAPVPAPDESHANDGNNSMEMILLQLQQERLELSVSTADIAEGIADDTQKISATATACHAFAESLRQFVSSQQPQQQEKQHVAQKGSNEAHGSNGKEEVTAEWLLEQCTSFVKQPHVSLPMEALDLALTIASACKEHKEENMIQSALFDVLGVDGFDLLQQLAPLAQQIALRISPEALRQIANNSTTEPNDTVMVDVEEERRQFLLEEARHAAHLAAMAKSALGNDSVSSQNKSVASMTHSVTRASDVAARKEAKRLQKAAANAREKARAAGALVDLEEDFGTSLLLNGNGNDDWTMPVDPHGVGQLAPEGSRQFYEPKRLPTGTERTMHEGYEMVTIPPPSSIRMGERHPRLVIADHMSAACGKAFAGTDSLNPMQSAVFSAAFHSHENLLICAPTGAGKTNVAMLAVVAHFRDQGLLPSENNTKSNNSNAPDPYAAYAHIGATTNSSSQQHQPPVRAPKVVYIAPMKALAQEVVEKFSSKLKPLKLIVKELTGDMQLTRAEAEAAHILVTTPEKWDVVTRKSGGDDTSLGRQCGLLIIDEVHLLADDRGAVIESVVARLHRLVESSQRQVRIVGLSATLPNYKDVATFLRVDHNQGLFYFGPEHRPVPLQQQFIGITTDQRDRWKREQKMNDICYDVVSDSLRRGHQVMVFVHSRKGTGETARALTERAVEAGELDRLLLQENDTSSSGGGNPLHGKYADRVSKSRNREVSEHFGNGMGIHHAGMLRNDRKLTEQMFADGAIKVLCCTATLAWGINLPARAVVVKGTEVYNPEKGGAVDLSILDVMQIFGRAGRPQFDTRGEATLITTHDALTRYLDKLVREVPIESNFIKQLSDHLNAEVVGGTVTNVQEAATWLAYTYLHVRMLRNPLAYGISFDQKEQDPMLKERSMELVEGAAKMLDQYRMIRYDAGSGNLASIDLGRVASHFYIRAESVATFNEMLEKLPSPSDADLCHIICCASEFENVKVRPEELPEVDDILKNKKACPLEVKAPVEEFSGKCCVLMQAFISNLRLKSFTLISDTNYIASNAGRVARALFEMCLRRGHSSAAAKLLRLAKSIDKRLWWFQTPLRQFGGEVPLNVYTSLEHAGRGDSFETAISLLDMTAQEVGQLSHWFKGGDKVQKLASYLPRVEIKCTVQPVTRGILRFQIQLDPAFDWNGRFHGGAEGFWLWVEDGENDRIYHHEHFIFSRRTHPEPILLEMSIPAFEPLPPQYYIRVVSDTWVGSETVLPVSFQHLMLPEQEMPYTDLMDLTPLPTSALQEPKFEQLYTFGNFNPIQTQLFHILYHTDTPVLVGAPTGSGKTIIAELALLRMKLIHPKAKCVYIAPLKSLARERLKEWRSRLGSPPLNWKVLELSGDTHHDARALNSADVLVCTPEKWDLITRGWRGTTGSFSDSNVSNGKQFVKDVRLLIIDEIHLLGEERGAVLEAIVSRTRFISRHVKEEQKMQRQASGVQDETDAPELTRIIGLSTALANPYDLADWIGIDVHGSGVRSKQGLYNFRPSVRPVPMRVHIQGYPGRHYCPRMATMNKPCYAAIKEHSPSKPTIIFVASRRQTRLTALDLISYAAGDEHSRAFLGSSGDAFIESVADTVSDSALRHTLTFGIGLHHAGLSSHDRETVERLFLDGDIRVLVATATLAWGVNLPAHLVIVKGTEYFDGKQSRYVDYPVTDVLQMMGRAGRPQFDTEGIACIMVAEAKKNFYKKFLYDPFPVESCLVERMCETLNAEISIGTIKSVGDAIGYLSWTFFARRAKMNPSFYGANSGSDEDLDEFFLSIIKETFNKLKDDVCILTEDDLSLDSSPVESTALGQAASNYYLQYRTPKQMRDGSREVRKMLLRGLESTNDTDEAPSGGILRLYSPSRTLEEAGVAHLLFTLAHTHEFDELPVRHTEDELNAELSERLPWGHDTKQLFSGGVNKKRQQYDIDVMADPHTKGFLLIQAHISRAKLPISDYINDTRTVIDQIPRLLAAMQYVSLDDSAASGSFDLMCMYSKVRQILATRSNVSDDPLNQIPGLQKDGARKLKQKGVESIRELRSMSSADCLLLMKGMVNSGRKGVSGAQSFLASLPLLETDNVRVSHVVDKTSGKSTGILHFDLSVKIMDGGGQGSRNKKERHMMDGSVSVHAILGSQQGHFLLSHQNIHVSNRGGGGGGGGPQQRSSPSSSQQKSVELSFDWNMANAHGGQDGGFIVLRLLLEDFRGMDAEIRIPLR